jgi:DHA1 family bicyclomycin/chloramphenicol resistance-like MFS transporter
MQKNIKTSIWICGAYGVMSVVALAIDALLPALDIIGITIGTTEVVDNHYSSLIFLVLFGPLVSAPFR